MPVSPPASPAATTLCARCGSQVGDGAGAGSCASCLAVDLAGGEWSDLLTSGGAELLAGGGFTLLEEIGHGGMGIVYRAQQRSPEREVALKLLPPVYAASGDGAQRLLEEAEMLAEMDHPGILPLYASGVQDGRPWLAMKLASGGTLAARQAEWQGRWRDGAELAAGLADALQHAHERGLIHRDLKPGNILFDEAGRAYVADFGLAKWRDRDSGLTHANTVLGTPAYMAPEVAQSGGRAATTASDVYGLGAIFYFLLCGQAPYAQTGTLDLLRRIAEEDPPPPRSVVPGVPADLQVICLKALARQPSGRYSGPDALAADLRRWLAGDAIEARPGSRAEKVSRWVRRHPLSAGLAALLAVTAAGGGTALWLKNRELATALEDVRLSLRTAYSTLAYATREVPAQLAPVVELKEMEALFLDVEGKLAGLQQSVSQPGAAGMVLQAELYAHWSRVRRSGGDYTGGREKIAQAIQLADKAILNEGADARTWVVQSMAHRLLTEQLTEDEDFTSGALELEKARSAVAEGLLRHPGDLNLRIEQAEIAHRECDSRWRKKNGPALELAARGAAPLWDALEPEVHRPGIEASVLRQWRERSAWPHYYLSCAALWASDTTAAEKHARHWRDICEARIADSPGSTDQRRDLAVASNQAATLIYLAHGKQPPESVQKEIFALLDRAEALGEELCQLDPANERWRAEWASAALSRAFMLCQPKGTPDGIFWLHQCRQRLENLQRSPRDFTQDVRIQLARNLAQAAEWEEKPALWNKVVAETARIAETPPYRWDTFAELIDAQQVIANDLLRKSPGPVEAAAKQWLTEARAAAARPGASQHWAAVEASLQRRLADAIAPDPARIAEARAANRAAFTLRAAVLRGVSLHARRAMTRGLASAAEKLFALAPIEPEDAHMVLREMTALAPVALADHTGQDWRDDWESAAQSALGALPAPEQETAANALNAALFPDHAGRSAAAAPAERRLQ